MLRPENRRMKDFLATNGIDCKVKYIPDGSLKRTWRLSDINRKWTAELIEKLTALGFVGFDWKPLDVYSGNGGLFSVFVRGHDELLEQ